MKFVFGRGVYVDKNTAQTASVEFFAEGKQIMHAADCKKLSEKPGGVFRQVKPGT